MRGQAEELVARAPAALVAQPGAILELQLEAAGVAELAHGRRREDEDVRLLDRRRALLVRAPPPLRALSRAPGALVPGLEPDERDAGVLARGRRS